HADGGKVLLGILPEPTPGHRHPRVRVAVKDNLIVRVSKIQRRVIVDVGDGRFEEHTAARGVVELFNICITEIRLQWLLRVFTYKYCLRQKIIVAGLAAERQAASERRPRSSESGRSDQDAPQMGWVRKGASQTCWRPARRIADSYDHSHLVARRRADDLPPV